MRFLILVLCLAAAGSGQDLELSFLAGKARGGAGDSVVAGIEVSIPQGFHLYGNPLGHGIGKPFTLTVNKNDNVEWTEVRKSAAKRYNPPTGGWVWAYQSKAYFFIKGVLSDGFTGGAIECDMAIEALICKTVCIPVEKRAVFYLSANGEEGSDKAFADAPEWRARYEKSEPMEFLIGTGSDLPPRSSEENSGGLVLSLEGLSALNGDEPLPPEQSGGVWGGEEEIAVWDYSPLDGGKEYNLLTAVFVALLAGLALNVTPCVFPMLGIRALSFVQRAGESRRRAFLSSIFFAGGIVSVFVLLAAFAAFAGFSWGQQFQSPYVIMALIALIFLFGLGLFDFYTFNLPSGAANAGRKAGSGLGGDFFKGMVATVLATPCGGPFLGALLAWALLQTPLTIFVLFTVMGAGMAVPYVLLSSSRRLLGLLPKPGRWMEDFKHVMGFLLFGFALYLMKSLDARLITVTAGICLSILCAASVNKRFAPFGASLRRRAAAGGGAVALLLAGTVLSILFLSVKTPPQSDGSASLSETGWREFSPRALKDAHARGENAVVNFTASWCSGCQVNKAAVLNSQAAVELHSGKNVTLFTADITNKNPQATDLLRHLGSRSVPFLAVFPADSPQRPVVMHGTLSKKRYLSVIKNLP